MDSIQPTQLCHDLLSERQHAAVQSASSATIHNTAGQTLPLLVLFCKLIGCAAHCVRLFAGYTGRTAEVSSLTTGGACQHQSFVCVTICLVSGNMQSWTSSANPMRDHYTGVQRSHCWHSWLGRIIACIDHCTLCTLQEPPSKVQRSVASPLVAPSRANALGADSTAHPKDPRPKENSAVRAAPAAKKGQARQVSPMHMMHAHML